jgi:tripartite-type tricarboxylate transporter receptor subunit TctC
MGGLSQKMTGSLKNAQKAYYFGAQQPFCPTSWSSNKLPAKPISFIYACPPAGAVKVFGHPLAKQLSTQIGATIVVDKVD